MADEDAIREAFSHIKQDIIDLKREIYFLKREIIDLKAKNAPIPTHIQQTNQEIEQTQHIISPDKPYLPSSIGNDGVPTDKQTDNKQTNRQALEPYFNTISLSQTSQFPDDKLEKSTQTGSLMSLVTNLKEEMRQNFLKLTKQEFLIFSVVYSLDDEGVQVTYPLIAAKTRLSESSIRDYISRIIEKGITLEKHKINNKQVIIRVKDELKSLATLDSLVKLREFSIDKA